MGKLDIALFARVLALLVPRMRNKGDREANVSAVEYFSFGSTAAAFVRSLVRNGRADAVGQFIQREGYPFTRVEMLVSVSEAVEKMDAVAAERYAADAEREAGLVDDGELRAEAFCDLADSAIRRSKTDPAVRFLDAALAAARSMREDYDSVERRDFAAGKAHTLARIALLSTEAERISESALVAHEAEAASRHITGDPSYYLPLISRALASSGHISLARRTADRTIDGSDRLSAYAAVLQGLTINNQAGVVRLIRDAEQQDAAGDEW